MKKVEETYYRQYVRRWCSWGHLWAGLVLIGVAALLGCQLWLWQSSNRADAWYGLDYDQTLAELMPEAQPVGLSETGLWGNVTLALEKYTQLERAYVLVNGRRAGSFVGDSLTVRVYDGDLLELDCTAYSRPVGFQLKRASTGIDRSLLQEELRLQGERAVIGRIKFR